MGCTVSTKFRKIMESKQIHKESEIKVEPSLFVTENKHKFQDVYRIAQSLGSGIYGEVKICYHRQTNQKRAVKLFRRELMNADDETSQLLKEISILRSLDHPNIIRVYEFFEDFKRLYLVMEYCGGGELFTQILKRQSFSESDSAKIFYQILSAVSYLHSQGIIHGDLNPENILLEEKHGSLNVKLADFGSAILKTDGKLKRPDISKPYYSAPEAYDGVTTEKSDMWSVGVILYILLCGHPPFDGENDAQIIRLVKRARVLMNDSIWDTISASAKDLISNLICPAPMRLTSQQALAHTWVNSQNNTTLSQGGITHVLSNLKAFHAPNKLKDAILTYLTMQFSSLQDTKELREIFLRIDKDKNGKISKEELVEQFKLTMGPEKADTESSLILKEVDTDNSGFIDYTEFLKANLDSNKLYSDQNLQMAFGVFDVDGSGKISVAELRGLLENGKQSDDEVWTNIIKSIDANGDGEIDLEEFKNIVRSNISIDKR